MFVDTLKLGGYHFFLGLLTSIPDVKREAKRRVSVSLVIFSVRVVVVIPLYF